MIVVALSDGTVNAVTDWVGGALVVLLLAVLFSLDAGSLARLGAHSGRAVLSRRQLTAAALLAAAAGAVAVARFLWLS